MEHTKEPWRIGLCGVDAETHPIESDDGFVFITDAHPADARRIVACVNACAGYSIESLEQPGGFMQTLGNVIDEIKELTRQRDHLERENAKQAELLNKVIDQRDELLAALEKICEADSDIGMWSIAAETLTKVKEQK